MIAWPDSSRIQSLKSLAIYIVKKVDADFNGSKFIKISLLAMMKELRLSMIYGADLPDLERP